MIIFKRYTDKASGLDIYDMYDESILVRRTLDPWTVKTVVGILKSLNIEYVERERDETEKI